MPKRENKASRRARQRAEREHWAALASDAGIYERIEIDSIEFATTFLIPGGREVLEGCRWVAFDRNGNQPEQPICHKWLSIGRDKASKLMAYAAQAEAIRRIRERMREERSQLQVQRILDAHDRGTLAWRAQRGVSDQQMRSILVGSSDSDPTVKSDGLVVCYRTDSGHYQIATETWDGQWSEPDEDGVRHRIGVTLDPMDVVFIDERNAQRGFMLAVRSGEMPGFDQVDPAYVRYMADRLRHWEHDGTDMKARVEKIRAGKRKKKGKRLSGRTRRVRLPQ